MRFRAGIQNIHVFTKLTTSLASLGGVAWLRLSEQDVRFTIIPEQGTQVWAVLQIDTIFDETFTIQSAADNVIHLEVPLAPLQRALKSAQNAISASIRLTKKDNIPLLSLTITTSILSSTPAASSSAFDGGAPNYPTQDEDGNRRNLYGAARASSTFPNDSETFHEESVDFGVPSRSDRETVITQDIPIRVLAPTSVQGLHEPQCREPDVHIMLPSLLQLKSISDRFTKLALSTGKAGSATSSGFRGGAAAAPKLELSANMHGCLRLRLRTDAMSINSTWTGLTNPELDPGQMDGIAEHPSTRMKQLGAADGRGEEGWATVRVDGRDWGRVLGVGRLDGRVIACFCHENALILYVYLSNEHDAFESVLTFYVSSYSA